MTEEQKLTGYPSIDKPWLKYYSIEQISAKLPECKIYEYIWNANKDSLDRTALNYYGHKITYREMFIKIEESALAFQSIGVKKGDVVSVLAVTVPETIYIFYGLNRIGAISNMIDPRTSIEGIREYIKEVDSKVVVVIGAIRVVIGRKKSLLQLLSQNRLRSTRTNYWQKSFRFLQKSVDKRPKLWYALIEPRERGSTKLQKERKGAIPMYNEETHRLSPVLAA